MALCFVKAAVFRWQGIPVPNWMGSVRSAPCWVWSALLQTVLLRDDQRSLRHLAAMAGSACECGPPKPRVRALTASCPGSKGLSCQRCEVKQVSKAPHISAD